MKVKLWILICAFLFSCSSEKDWVLSEKIELPKDVRPLGLTLKGDQFWISDPDNNRILQISNQGQVLDSVTNLNRPMHITSNGEIVYIPNFTSDTIATFENEELRSIKIGDSLDAPASVAMLDKTMAIADFYNHRVLLIEDDKIINIGSEGRTDGLLYYPTDVALTKDRVVVADAYNNRVQVFDRNGQFIKVIGWQENIQVATGVEVFKNEIFITDFYGNRVLIYDFSGKLLAILSEGLNKPTDVIRKVNKLLIANYGENGIAVFNK